MTLYEVIHMPNFKLFDDDIDIIGYEDLQRIIIDEYMLHEINYGTPDYFRLKLNHYLRVRADNYNKMLKSQLIEIDPFVTDYIVSYRNDQLSNTTEQVEKSFDTINAETNTVGNRDLVDKENFTGSGKEKTTGSNAGSVLRGKLSSDAENRNTVGNSEKDSTYEKNTLDTLKQTEEVLGTKHSKENVKQREDTDYSETKDGRVDITTHDESDRHNNSNQPERNWTEKGSSSAHNLSVRSDTPQAMLFNEPNNYYGTGRAHDYGKVVSTPNGPVYQHYPEFEPSQIDQGNYNIGSGNTPWYNYASNADNKTGHDGYAKDGTETYKRNEAENIEKVATSHETNHLYTVGDKVVNLTRQTDYDETTTEDTELNSTRNIKENGKSNDKTSESTLDAFTRNSQENQKEDSVNNAVGDKAESSEHETVTVNNVKSIGNSETKTGKESQSNTGSKLKSDSDSYSTRKGRTMRSPSNLLLEYRKTLTFNADMWLLSELRPLFLQIF